MSSEPDAALLARVRQLESDLSAQRDAVQFLQGHIDMLEKGFDPRLALLEQDRNDAQQRCERAEVLAAWQGCELTEGQAAALTGLDRFALQQEWEDLAFRVLRRWREHRDRQERQG